MCLAPGIPSQIRQGLGLIVGVTVGILVGELALLIPADLAAVRMASATFVAMMIAAAFGMAPVVTIQAGASAMLVLLMGPQVAGLARFLDVLIGASTGLIVALVFFRERLKF